jgi:hypothetical protein
MTPELIQIWLAVVGWFVAFLLGKELATGYLQWRTRHSDNEQRRP